MGINIGLDESGSAIAPCRDLRRDVRKVHLDDPSGFDEYLEYDVKVDLETAKGAVGDWDAFLKRNRINAETDAVYMDKVKKDEDRKILEPLAVRETTGWVLLDGAPGDVRSKAVAASGGRDTVTGWDCLSFDEMNDMCASCPLSWDKGRGCVGAFGPDNTLLPSIAEKHGCPLIASVPRVAKEGGRFTPAQAEEVVKECEKLRHVLPEEGKMMVRRYSGPIDRTEAAAKAAILGGCDLVFF